MTGTGVSDIVLIIFSILNILLTVVIVPLIKRKTTIAQQEELANWVKVAVNAAEQIIQGTKLGQKRKAYVYEYLHSIGIDLSDDKLAKEVDTLIESFVNELNRDKVTKE